jgi:hypothetical protein
MTRNRPITFLATPAVIPRVALAVAAGHVGIVHTRVLTCPPAAAHTTPRSPVRFVDGGQG